MLTYYTKAREARADVEFELLSSVSSETFEIWKNNGVSRQSGDGRLVHAVVYAAHSEGSRFPRLGLWLTYDSPVNLSLNLFDRLPDDTEKSAAIALAVLLQLCLLVLPGLITYRWQWQAGDSGRVYGFPCYAAGSAIMAFGMFLCARCVHKATRESSPIGFRARFFIK